MPDLQPLSYTPEAFDQVFGPRRGSSNSVKAAKLDQEPYVPVNYICPKAYALLAAAEASASRRVDSSDDGAMEIDGHGDGSTLQSASDAMYDPERRFAKMPPPKKFYKTFWRSVSRGLLRQSSQSALPLKSQFEASPTRAVA